MEILATVWFFLYVVGKLGEAALDYKQATKTGGPTPRQQAKYGSNDPNWRPAQPGDGGYGLMGHLGACWRDLWPRRTAAVKAARDARDAARAADPAGDRPGLIKQLRIAQQASKKAATAARGGAKNLTKPIEPNRWSWSCSNPECPAKNLDYPTRAAARQAAREHNCTGDQPSAPQITKRPDMPGPNDEGLPIGTKRFTDSGEQAWDGFRWVDKPKPEQAEGKSMRGSTSDSLKVPEPPGDIGVIDTKTNQAPSKTTPRKAQPRKAAPRKTATKGNSR